MRAKLLISIIAVLGAVSAAEAVELRLHVGPKISLVRESYGDDRPFRGLDVIGTVMFSDYPFGFLVGADFDVANQWDYEMPSMHITMMPIMKFMDFKIAGYRADPWAGVGLTFVYYERPLTYPILFPLRGGLLWHLSQDGFSRWTVICPEVTFSWFTYYVNPAPGFDGALVEANVYLTARFGVGYQF